jgi:hypothetical protein
MLLAVVIITYPILDTRPGPIIWPMLFRCLCLLLNQTSNWGGMPAHDQRLIEASKATSADDKVAAL